MINDFKEVTAVVWVKKLPEAVIIDAWSVGGEHKGYQDADDSIGIFINYKMVFETKIKEEATRYIQKLVEQSPTELREHLVEFQHYLLEAVDDNRTGRSV